MTTYIDLDPIDWDEFRADAHRALDGMIDHLASLRTRPVWTATPPETRRRFEQKAPRQGRDLAAVLADVERHVVPHVVGNTHPRFFGWVHGAGTPVGMVAEMIAAGLNANCGGRDHIGLVVERQIAAWVAEAFGFPPDASGIFVTGASTGNFLSVVVARHEAARSVRRSGLGSLASSLVAYASTEAHECVGRAMELSGLGRDSLRRIPIDSQRRMDTGALRTAIERDRAAGHIPFLVVGSAGTVDTGAIDDLAALADIAEAEDLWFHVDGAFGALAAFSEVMKPRLKGLDRADSVAFDFHKWFHVPYDAGFFLVRDKDVHRSAFASEAAYLGRDPRGLAAGAVWPCDLGMDLSRGFRALKTWMTIEFFGIDRLTAVLYQTCELALRLGRLVEQSDRFVVLAPISLNIVCLAPRDDPSGELAREIVMDLHESGTGVPSMTILDGRPAIRVAICNHRTRDEDVDALMRELERAERGVRDRKAGAARLSHVEAVFAT